MTLCDTDAILRSILRQLACGSPCENDLAETIPALWELVRAEACYSVYIQGLLTRREVILFLMGCEAYSVDAHDRHRLLEGNTVADSTMDLRTQSQSTANSTRFAIGHGETRYDESNTARSQGTMDRHDRATETGDGSSFYRDDGKGNGFNNSESFNSIDAVEQEEIRNIHFSTKTETGHRSDCNYEYSTNNTNGQAAAILPLATFSFSGGGSEWRKFQKTRASDHDDEVTTTTHYDTRDVDDDRRGRGTHDWLSQFLADIEWREKDYEIKVHHDRTDTRRHAEAHARGDGDGFSEEKAEAHNAAQGTLKSELRTATDRTVTRADTISVIQLANSQRFDNLRRLYDQYTEQIAFAKRRLRMRAPALVAALSCNCQGCCRCAPTLRSMGLHAYVSLSGSSESFAGEHSMWSA